MSLRLIDIGETRVITLRRGDSTDKAIALMEEHGIHHLPVVADDKPIGMVSDRDLLLSVGWLSRRERFTDDDAPGFVGPTKVAQVLSNPIQSLPGDARPEDGIHLMLEHNIHALPLVFNEQLVGIVTKIDLLELYLDDHQQATSRTSFRFAKVRDHMRAHVFFMRPSDTISAAVKLMHEKHIRHLPIVTREKPVGVVSDRDIRRALGRVAVDATATSDPSSEHRYNTRMGEVMSTDVITVGPSASLAEAAELMVGCRVGMLPVIFSDRMIGVLTETDLLRVLASAIES